MASKSQVKIASEPWKSSELFAMFGALPRPVLMVGKNKAILFANGMAEEFFQMGAAMLTRHGLVDIVPVASPILALVDKVQQQGRTVHEYDIDLSTPRVGNRHADVLGALIPEIEHACILMFEGRSMAEKMGRHLQHRGASRTVSGMAAVLAHEIKNPLAGIKGAAQLMESQLPESERQLPQLICLETDRIVKLVDKMTSFGAPAKMERVALNIHDVLDHVHRLASSSFAQNIKIIETYDPSLPLVLGDRDALVQVFLNLVRNASDALVDVADPTITLATSFRAGVRLATPTSKEKFSLPLEVSVTDNGSGIGEDILQHMFDPFVTTKRGGTGLGLALVAKIIDEHGGIIDCTSVPGKTCFRLLLPIESG